jgi:acyl-CoA synthetase (NDP forming)
VTTKSFRDLSPLLNPKAIAVVGASERPGSAGRLVLQNLQHLGFEGPVYAVHPRHGQVLGFPCYPNLQSLPGPVDSVAILLGAQKALTILEQMAEIGAPAAWLLAAGFAEAGPEGEAREAELIRIAQENGLLVCGPNCIGVADLVDGSATYSVALSPKTRAGGVSAVVQSGAICLGLANSARFGFRTLISSGNEAVLDSADYIGHLVNDPHTKVIVAFLEGIKSPEKFIAAAKAAAEVGKPILALKVGRSEMARRTVQAHTGSLAGSDQVMDAVFRRLGVTRLDTLDELLEAAELFVTCPVPEGEGVGLLSLSGGQIGLIADLAQDLGLTFPRLSDGAKKSLEEILPPFSPISNPLDAWGSGDLETTYPACLEIVSQEEHLNLLAVSRGTPEGAADREVEQSLAVADAAVEAVVETGKPVLLFSNFSAGFQREVRKRLEEGGVPYLQGTKETLRAIKAFLDYAAFRRKAVTSEQEAETRRGCPSPATLSEWRRRLERGGEALSEAEARRLLTDYGVPAPHEYIAESPNEAVERAQAIGYPVVLKILSPAIQHKTEVGGVRVGLGDEAAVRSAFQEVMEAAQERHPYVDIEGVLIQEMFSDDAVEVIIGVLRDADFGPVVVFGSGGVLVELLEDSALRLPPLSRREAREMIEETQADRLLRGFRGKPRADVEALVGALVRISQLAVDLGDQIAALDINPLMVLPEGRGVRAVDALVEIA